MTDLSTLSDAELTSLYQQSVAASPGTSEIATPPGPLKLRVGPAQKAPSEMSDEELVAAYQASQPSAGQRVALDFMNQGSAASQGTTPSIEAHKRNLISSDTYQNDAGEVLYRDPATGQLVPTDQNKHVALRDPADNTVKVFARTGGFTGTNEGRLAAGARLLATGLAAGAPIARPGIPLPTPQAPSRAALRAAATEAYSSPEIMGLEVKPSALERFSQSAQSTLEQAGANERLAPKAFGLLQDAGKVPEGAVSATGQNLDTLRRTLGTAAGSVDPTERRAAKIAMQALDDFIATMPQTDVIAGDAARAAETWGQARGNYAAAKRSEQIGKAVDRAELQAGSAGSGANINNATRQQFKAILNNPNKLRGYSPEEQAQIRTIVEGTVPANAARYVGKLAPTGIISGIMSPGAGAAVGSLLGATGATGTGLAAAAFPAIGFVAKKLGDVLTARHVARLDEMVRSRSPLAKALEATSSKWAKTAEELTANPSSTRLAAFLMASRNAANTLKGAGISVSPADFIKALQAPVRSRADDEQQKP